MRLAFKNFSFGYTLKEVPITLKIGTLEDTCNTLGIEFWQMGDYLKKENIDFITELLYQGYVTACKESFKKPKYSRIKAIIWYEHMTKEAQKEFMGLMTDLFGKLQKSGDKKKVKAKQAGENSVVLPSENFSGPSSDTGMPQFTSSTKPAEDTGDTGNGQQPG